MSTTLPNMGLIKSDLNDDIKQTILTSSENFQTIDDSLGALIGTAFGSFRFVTDGSGNIIGIQGIKGGQVIADISWTYNSDGTINKVTELVGDKSIVSTFLYVNGELTLNEAIVRSVTDR